jgi:hypothetical protein
VTCFDWDAYHSMGGAGNAPITPREYAPERLTDNELAFYLLQADSPPMRRQQPEHHDQSIIFAWARLYEDKIPALRLMFAVPNAARRSPRQAAWLKAEGMKAGVPDIWLPVPMGNAHGLVIELKSQRSDGRWGTVTLEQREWLDLLAARGYTTAVCLGAQEAMRTIATYLNINQQVRIAAL